ncbi:glycosyltransferase family 4 protein [Paenarthrobacter sp. NPDC057981]|uniref:glycosyltransferase family 4 protein n=1 Tax=Paenarthrobacter sp. NPDC057981 TaxID=3346297 RepID=UPI0036D78B28
MPDPGERSRRLHGSGRVEVLTVGVKWHRKGIDRAVNIVDALGSHGLDVHLNVVGTQPPDTTWHRRNVTYHGHLRKDRREGRDRLSDLYASADLFLLPTRNEPFGIVFQEAAAYALPSVTSSVGGVPEVVQNGVTGVTLVEEATIDDYVRAVRSVLEPDVYEVMSASARRRYEAEFTWKACARKVVQACEVVLKPSRPGAGL